MQVTKVIYHTIYNKLWIRKDHIWMLGVQWSKKVKNNCFTAKFLQYGTVCKSASKEEMFELKNLHWKNLKNELLDNPVRSMQQLKNKFQSC